MANEIRVTYTKSQTNLTANLYTSAGAARQTAIALTETPAASGLYLGTPTDIDDGDIIVAYHNGAYIGGERYLGGVDLITAGEIADAVWDEANRDHIAQGTTGQRLHHSGGSRL